MQSGAGLHIIYLSVYYNLYDLDQSWKYVAYIKPVTKPMSVSVRDISVQA